MKKTFLIWAMAVAFCGIGNAQDYVVPVETWDYEEINGSNYHGYNFHESWDVDFTIENQDGRYTPTEEDIAEAERLIQKRIAYVNRHHINQEGMCPVIDEHMAGVATRYYKPLAVEVAPLGSFYSAEEYHQDYLTKNPSGYCHLSPELFELARRVKAHDR